MITRIDTEHDEFPNPATLVLRGLEVRHPSSEDQMYKRSVQLGDFYEWEFLDTIKKLDLKGTYIDGGAHCGNHSIFFSRFCLSTIVISVEAARDLQPILAHNLRMHGESQGGAPSYLVHAALGLGNSQWASVGTSGSNTGDRSAYDTWWNTEWAIPSLSLDTIIQGVLKIRDLDPVVFLKLDIEGAENGALEGAANILLQDTPVITCETGGKRDNGRLIRGSIKNQRDTLDRTIQKISRNQYSTPVRVPTYTPILMWTPKGSH